jgi:hypothetical protein
MGKTPQQEKSFVITTFFMTKKLIIYADGANQVVDLVDNYSLFS